MSGPTLGIEITGSAVTADLSSLPVTCVSVLLFLSFAFPTHLRVLTEDWRMLYTRKEDSSTSYKFKGSLNLMVCFIQGTHTHTRESGFFPEMTSFQKSIPSEKKKMKMKSKMWHSAYDGAQMEPYGQILDELADQLLWSCGSWRSFCGCCRTSVPECTGPFHFVWNKVPWMCLLSQILPKFKF